jgi:lysophospholipase L1-like esterase
MKNSIFTLILLFSLSTGCSSEKLPEEDNMPYQSFSYLALGDSYTIGQGVPVKDRYPVQLQDRLANANVPVDSLLIIARTGWTTDELSRGIDATETHPPYDLVTLLIGVNNQFRGRDPENYRDEFVMLLNRAIGFAGDDKGRVVVLSIPDWGVTPFASGRDRDKIAREIDLFNAINREESENAGVAWLDVTEISRLAANRPELLAPDGLHPSGLMYQMWVDELFPIAKKILTEN